MPEGATPPPGQQAQQGTLPPGYPPPAYQQQPPPAAGYPPPGYVSAANARYADKEKEKRFPVWGWVIMGVVGIFCVGCVAMVVGVGGIFGSAVGVGSTTGEFYSDLRMGQYKKAHALLGPQMAALYTPEDLRTDWQLLESDGPVSFQVGNDAAIENGRARLSLVFVTANGTRTTTLTLQQSGRDWKITGAEPALIP
jgi:hypothetical protein